MHALTCCGCLSVCWTWPCKNAELIEMLFVVDSRGPKEPCVRWGCLLVTPGEYDGLSCAVAAMWPLTTITVATCYASAAYPMGRYRRHYFFTCLFVCACMPGRRHFLAGLPLTSGFCICCPAATVTEEFHYDLAYTTAESRSDIEPTVAIQLAQQHRDPTSGLVYLAFNVIYAPFKVMTYVLHAIFWATLRSLGAIGTVVFGAHSKIIIKVSVWRHGRPKKALVVCFFSGPEVKALNIC